MQRICQLILALLLAALTACGKPPLHQQESFVFGTRVEILIAGVDEAKARPAANAVLAEFDRLHRTYHAWRPSELSELNTSVAAGKSAEVSEEMARILADAQRLSALGEGLFDPGIGQLIRLWGFQSDEFKAALPPADAIAAWRKAPPGMGDLNIKDRLVSSRNRAVAIDLGGYLKGYALDRATQILREHAIGNALINIGGNIMALGAKNGEAWRVGIQHPRQPGPLAILSLKDGEAIGTSGDYQRYFELDGQRYCHLLDPRSGTPIQHTQAVSVLITPRAAAGTLSDVGSKPLLISGEDWPRLARQFSIDHVLRIDAKGRIQVSEPLSRRLEFAGGRPADMEILPTNAPPSAGNRGIP